MTSTQDTTSQKTQSATGQQHHHHHHHHMDDSERYKRDNFNSMKRQPIIEKLIFILSKPKELMIPDISNPLDAVAVSSPPFIIAMMADTLICALSG